MEKIKRKCCICGKEFKGWGNNPWGALDKIASKLNGVMMIVVAMNAMLNMSFLED